jgi:D-3-phosphoglycerate dehydrogenase
VLLVNTARGPVVEEEALVRALASGKVAGAALDVMEHEPLLTASLLSSFDQVVFGSHNASTTAEACERVHWRALQNLDEALGMAMP